MVSQSRSEDAEEQNFESAAFDNLVVVSELGYQQNRHPHYKYD
jgi:hypothetical protein